MGIQTPMAQGRSTKIISTIKWIRNRSLSIKNYLSLQVLQLGTAPPQLPTPSTLHPTLYTLHPTPYTLHVRLIDVCVLQVLQLGTALSRGAACSALVEVPPLTTQFRCCIPRDSCPI